MDLAVVMRPEVLADKLEDGRVRGRAVATWNTRRLPTRLTPGWTNRLFVASQGRWRGYFPLSGDVFCARYRQRSTIVVSNLPFKQLGEFLPSPGQAVAIADRLVDDATILRFTGKPYRQPRDVHGAPLDGE